METILIVGEISLDHLLMIYRFNDSNPTLTTPCGDPRVCHYSDKGEILDCEGFPPLRDRILHRPRHICLDKGVF